MFHIWIHLKFDYNYRDRILAARFANCEAYFINCEGILLDFQSPAKQAFLIFELINFTDKINRFLQINRFLKKYKSNKNI